MISGIVVAIVRHVRRIRHIPKLTLTLCHSVLRGMLIKLTHEALIASDIKSYAVREILATVVTHVIGKRTQANNNIILLC